jgi:signal transduction histidine kinase
VSTERTPLRTLIGGRWAFSWQGYLIVWPFAVLFLFFGAPALWESDTVLEGLIRGFVIGTLAYLPVVAVMWLISISIARNRHITPLPITLVALIGAVAWTARSFVVIAALALQGLPSDVPPANRIVSGIVQGALTSLLTAWILAKISSFRDQRRQLLSDLVQEELANERLREQIEDKRLHLLTTVRETVDSTVQSLNTSPASTEPSGEEVESLAQATKKISKDLARELWDDAASATRIGPMALLRSAVANRPFALWAQLPIIVLGLYILPIFWTFTDAVIVLAILSIYSSIIAVAANMITPRLRPNAGLVAYAIAILLLLGTAIVLQVSVTALGLTPPQGDALPWLAVLNFGVLLPLVGLSAHIGRAQQQVLTQIRRSITETEIQNEALRSEESRIRRDLAYTLHGGLQADLTASTMRAQQAIDQGDAATARQTLDQAKDLIQRSWDVPELARTDLRNTARSVVESWEGFVNIELNINVAREPSSRTIANIKEVLLEGIGNAVRHGRAKNIVITITDHAGDLRITITDDGTGVTGSRIGLGSAMFDDIAPNAWSLTPAPTGGATLTVALTTKTRT